MMISTLFVCSFFICLFCFQQSVVVFFCFLFFLFFFFLFCFFLFFVFFLVISYKYILVRWLGKAVPGIYKPLIEQRLRLIGQIIYWCTDSECSALWPIRYIGHSNVAFIHQEWYRIVSFPGITISKFVSIHNMIGNFVPARLKKNLNLTFCFKYSGLSIITIYFFFFFIYFYYFCFYWIFYLHGQ